MSQAIWPRPSKVGPLSGGLLLSRRDSTSGAGLGVAVTTNWALGTAHGPDHSFAIRGGQDGLLQ